MRKLLGISLFLLTSLSFLSGFLVAHICSTETQIAIASLEQQPGDYLTPPAEPIPTSQIASLDDNTTSNIVIGPEEFMAPVDIPIIKQAEADPETQSSPQNALVAEGSDLGNKPDVIQEVGPRAQSNNEGENLQPATVEEAFAQHDYLWPVTTLSQQPHIVQVASFLVKRNADDLENRLLQMDMTPFITSFNVGDKTWHAVVIGPFSAPSEAYQTARKIQAEFDIDPLVRRQTQGLVKS